MNALRGRWACALLGVAFAVSAEAQDPALARSVRALEASDVLSAERAFAETPEALQKTPEGTLQAGMIAFYAGRYEVAARALESAVAGLSKSPRLPEYRKLLEWAAAARDLTRDFVEARSPDGRFLVRHAPGLDAVLVDYALATLAAADEALKRRLGIVVPGPIRLEIYPSARAFAQVSSLSLENIETTGTVALCKWNRLMIATPRSLLYGYPWLDTIQHEFVHLALTYASKNHAPVWFHEGLAKLYERTWRGEEPRAGLTPPAEAALQRAAREQRLITFDAMHPSIAMLPSQEDAALAFAEVSTLLEHVREARGDSALRNAISRMAEGADAREALGAAVHASFGAVESAWRDSIPARQKPRDADAHELKVRLVERGASDPSADVGGERAKKHLRLGDLLWGQHRTQAAASEYKSGQRSDPDDAILASRVARAALALARPADAVTALNQALAVHPQHAPLLSLRGRAALALGDLAGARTFLAEAIRQNPFDPEPHCGLVKALPPGAEREREARACSAVGGEAPPP
jgi:tetratricopeptide (TPR) repeat protein